ESIIAQVGMLTMIGRNCGRIYHKRLRRIVTDDRWNQVNAIFKVNAHSLFRQSRSQGGRGTIISTYLHTLMHKPASQRAHANAADSKEVDMMILREPHLFCVFISFSISSTMSSVALGFAIAAMFSRSRAARLSSNNSFNASSTNVDEASLSVTITAASRSTRAMAFFV